MIPESLDDLKSKCHNERVLYREYDKYYVCTKCDMRCDVVGLRYRLIKWEYLKSMVLENDLEHHLKTMGEDGWELIHLSEISSRDVLYFTLIFKRPKV